MCVEPDLTKEARPLADDRVRVIKISERALFEFVYETFIDHQEAFLDVDPLKVTDSFAMDFDRREFLFCVRNTDRADGTLQSLPDGVNLEKLMHHLPDTTPTMYAADRYREFSMEELVKLSQEPPLRKAGI